MSIVLENVTKIFDTQTAVNNISFHTKKGEIVGFLGPNGAGKSTTMKMIASFLVPTSGTIKVCGMDVTENSLETRRKIGYLPESNPLYYEMYVREYLHFCAGIYKLGNNATKTVAEMIGLTGLTIESNKKIGALSKGYKQRVGLAQAMLHNPEILILDEPTSGLDPNQLVDIRDLIINLGKEKTVLLSTHIMQEVQAMCSRAIIINKGNIVADSPLSEIYSTVQNGTNTISLTTKQKVSYTLFKNIEGAHLLGDNTIQVTTTNADNAKKELLKICLENNYDIESLQSTQNNLEDVFRTLTQAV